MVDLRLETQINAYVNARGAEGVSGGAFLRGKGNNDIRLAGDFY